MNTLYFVALYNHPRNEWSRLLITATSEEAARERAESDYNDGEIASYRRTWKAKTARSICSTADEVWTEV